MQILPTSLTMRTLPAIIAILLLVSLTACGSSAKNKVEKKEMQAKGDARVQLTNKYKECIVKAAGDKAKSQECDSYLDAIKKLK